MTKTLHGKVHGRTIELDEDPGVAEGQEVEVQVRAAPPSSCWPAFGGRDSAHGVGALADDAELDVIMEEIHQQRKLERRPRIPDLGGTQRGRAESKGGIKGVGVRRHKPEESRG